MRTFGCCRFVYNYYLARRTATYEQTGRTLSYYDCAKDLTKLKQQSGTLWLREIDATALQSAIRDLDRAYQNFFRRVKEGDKPGYPKFKRKHSPKQSYRSTATSRNIRVRDGAVQLPKLGDVKCRVSRPVQGSILSATVSRSASGRYYVALCCRRDADLLHYPSTGVVIGLDMGIRSFATSSDGVEYPNPRPLHQAEKKLARLQRQLSRKTKGSKNWNKTRVRVARLHESITNQRRDMQHKLSTRLVRENDIICIEDLAINDMLRTHTLAKYISDASWGEFRRQLTYKAEWYGKQIVTVDRFYPSSQICSACGARWPGTKDTRIQHWVCPECKASLDRHINAAINILHEGMRSLV